MYVYVDNMDGKRAPDCRTAKSRFQSASAKLRLCYFIPVPPTLRFPTVARELVQASNATPARQQVSDESVGVRDAAAERVPFATRSVAPEFSERAALPQE